MPKSKSVKITSEPRNFHFDSKYPLIAPIIDERMVTGTTVRILFQRFGLRRSNASRKPGLDRLGGRFHLVAKTA
jgi:hypothetical protein